MKNFYEWNTATILNAIIKISFTTNKKAIKASLELPQNSQIMQPQRFN